MLAMAGAVKEMRTQNKIFEQRETQHKQGNVLDKLNLDVVVQSYVEKLSGYAGTLPSDYEDKIEVYEKEYKLLELMYSHDMDSKSAAEVILFGISGAILFQINESLKSCNRPRPFTFLNVFGKAL